MKKIIFTLLLALGMFTANAQEKGFYLTGSGSLGMNYFRYTLPDGSRSTPRVGFGVALGVQYYFTENWGVASGLGLSHYNTKGNFSASYKDDAEHYSFSGMYDPISTIPQTQNYTLNLKLENWTETQQAYFLEIPLMLMYQTKWGPKESVGMYFGLGVKAQIPAFGKTAEVTDDSQLDVYGFTENGVLWSDPPLPKYGFGTTKKTGYESDFSVKTSFAGAAEVGFLFSLSRRVDLTVGAYLDYGFNNIKSSDAKENLIEPNQKEYSMKYIGDNLNYNGYLNSYAVDKVNTMAYGAKLGLRVKLGKLKERKEPAQDTIRPGTKDTLFVIYMPQPDTTPRVVVQQPTGPIQGGTDRVQPTDDDLRILFEPIFFDLDKDILLPQSKIILNRKAAILERYPKMQLLVTGNTCDLGTSPHNIDLGQRRATAAKQYLEDMGISKMRISTVSQSFSHPMMPNINEENREKNRRCDFYPTGY